MKLIVVAVLLAAVLLSSSDEVSGAERQLFKNVRSDRCPEGVVFRAGCKICFCIELHHGQVVTKCKSKYSAKVCAAVAEWSHCEGYNLAYDYKEECEGACTCNDAKNMTTCENLPCDDTLLWFHGYYNASEKGQPVSADDVNVMDSMATPSPPNNGNDIDGPVDDNLGLVSEREDFITEGQNEDNIVKKSRSHSGKKWISKDHQEKNNENSDSEYNGGQRHKSANDQEPETRSLGGSKRHVGGGNSVHHSFNKNRGKQKPITTTTATTAKEEEEEEVTHRPKRRRSHRGRSKREAPLSLKMPAGDAGTH